MTTKTDNTVKRLSIVHFIYRLTIVLVIFCVATEAYTYVHAPLDSQYLPNGTAARIIFYFSFFTVLSNIALAIGALFWLKHGNHHALGFKILRLDGVLGVLITALVYHLIIRKVHTPPSMLMAFVNEGLHVVIPLLGGLGWLISKPAAEPRITLRLILLAAIPPIFYIIYILIRGAITGLYPYPFLNAEVIGYFAAFINIGCVVLLFLIFAGILLILEKYIPTCEY